MNPFHNLFRRGRSNLLKIICLAFGITAGLLLIAKVHFESSFDTFFPDNERVYQFRSYIVRGAENGDGAGEMKDFGQVSGGIAPAMMEEIPSIEVATRMTGIFDDAAKFRIADDSDGESKIMIDVVLADSLWFDVFNTEILAGDPHDVLGSPMSTMVSRSVAEKLGGIEAAIGKTLVYDSNDRWRLTVGGVFEDYPENSTFRYDAISSIHALPQWSLDNWLGNDRYLAYAKLRDNADPGEVEPLMRKVQEKHVDMRQLEEAGLDLSYGLMRMSELHRDDPKIRNLNNLMLLVAGILIVIAVMNYILIVLSGIAARMKEIAVRKCYGVSRRGIIGIVMGESLVNLLLAMILGAVMAFAFKGVIEEMLGVSYHALFTPATSGILGAIIGAVLLLTVAIPSMFFIRIPVTGAFRSMKAAGGFWKKCLLFIEFAGAAYVAVMLVNITRQYNFMMDYDLGYEFDNLVYCNLNKLDESRRKAVVSEIRRLPQVQGVTLASDMPIDVHSGNNVYLPGDKRELFNITDLYYVTDGWFETLNVPVIEGRKFSDKESNVNNVMVSRSFVKKIKRMGVLGGSPVGWEIFITEHENHTTAPLRVIGVFEDIKAGSALGFDERPQVLFFDNPNNNLWKPSVMLVRLNELTPDNIAAVNQAIRKVDSEAELIAESYRLLINQAYRKDRNLRDSLIACCVIALVITLSGLIGYVTDTMNRRRREIAIRKVNGAGTGDVLKMLVRGISILSLPALAAGAALAWISTARWLSDYSCHIRQSIPLTLLCIAAVYIVVLACVIIRARRAASENPVNALYSN